MQPCSAFQCVWASAWGLGQIPQAGDDGNEEMHMGWQRHAGEERERERANIRMKSDAIHLCASLWILHSMCVNVRMNSVLSGLKYLQYIWCLYYLLKLWYETNTLDYTESCHCNSIVTDSVHILLCRSRVGHEWGTQVSSTQLCNDSRRCFCKWKRV